MKIVSVGDTLLTPEMIDAVVPEYSRYTESKTFFFGPRDRTEMRAYIKKMEAVGFDCEPLPEEILREIEDADVLHMHMCPVPAAVFERGKKLKFVASNRGGTENIDIATATKYGVPVICNPAHNANGVAELTVSMIIAEMRNLARCHASMREHKKWRESFPNSGNIHELSGNTVGLLGCGTIGTIMVRLLKAFNMNVLVSDPYADPAVIEAMGAKLVDQETLLRTADVVSMHARVSPSTVGMMGREQFAMMNPTAIFVNSARPALVDTKAMIEALKTGQIMGAALDVYDVEPIEPDNPLLELDNVTFCCHKGGDTVECFANSPKMVLDQTERYFAGETPRFLTNPEVLKGGTRI